MRAKRILVPLALALVLVGCAPVPSLQPLFTENDLVLDGTLVGTWVDEEEAQWTFKQANENSYELIVANEGKQAKYKLHLVRLGESLFMDALPDPSREDAVDRYVYLMPTHVFGRIWIEDDVARLAMLDDEWLKAKVEAGEIDLRHELVEDAVILTASTEELQDFVQRYADDEGAFAVKVELHRQE